MRMIDWIVRRFRPNGAGDSSGDNGKHVVEPGREVLSEPTVLLWSPLYDDDERTQYLNTWLQELRQALEEEQTVVVGPHATREEALNSLSETRGAVIIKVFCGHGNDDALLGPPDEGSTLVSIGSQRHAIWYHESMIEPLAGGAVSLFAFCCRTANKLGKRFGSFPNRFFLGYNADLPFELTEKEYEDSYRRIIHTIVREIARERSVSDRHRVRLRELYASEINRLSRSQDLFIAAHLNEHRRSVRFRG